MAKGYLSNRQKNLKIGISSYTENTTALQVIGNVGIGTTNATSELYVDGNTYITGILTANRIISSAYGEFTGGTIVGSNIVGTSLSISGISTLGTVQISSGIITATTGVVTYYGDGSNLTGITASGEVSISVNTDNSNQYLTYATGFGNTTGLGATNSIVYNPSTGRLGIGTTNPQTTIQLNGVLGFTNSNMRFGIGNSPVGTTTGLNNIFMGCCSGTSNTGSYNNFFGSYSGRCNTTGCDNIFMGRSSGITNTTGRDNTFFGRSSGYSNISGNSNIFIGPNAGYANTTGSYNIFLGEVAGGTNVANFNFFAGLNAGCNNSTGPYNTFFGAFSGQNNTSGNINFFVGLCAGYNNTIGGANNFIGALSGFSNITGGSNNYFGGSVGAGNTDGCHNNFLGYYAGRCACTGSWNNFFGNSAGYCAVGSDNNFFGREVGVGGVNYYNTGSFNNFIGYRTGYFNSTGSHNTFMGICAGYGNTSGQDNIFMGRYSGCCNSCGCNNVFLGAGAGRNNTTGGNNFFVGPSAGQANTSANSNIFIGPSSGSCNSGDYNIFLGLFSGQYNTTGTQNNFIGLGAGKFNTSGGGNIFFGTAAGGNNTVGGNNNYIGVNAGAGNTDGNYNNFLGYYAGRCSCTGSWNNFFGNSAGYWAKGSDNNFFGREVGVGEITFSTGSFNNFFGRCAGYTNTSGSYNNFFGLNAGRVNTSGCNNIFLGQSAGCSNTTGSDNIVIGRGRNTPIINGSTQLVIGSGSNDWITGDSSYNVGIGTTNPTSKLSVVGDVNISGATTATSFSGDGSALTNLNASNLSSGTVPAARITTTNALTVLGDLYVSNNISFGGTTTQLNLQQLEIVDPDIVLGIGTSFSPTDNTANHGGIAIASTEGSPLVSLNLVPAETNPSTYKKIMWFKGDTIGAGLTDAWLFNYAVGIGSTQVPNNVYLAAGNVQFTQNDLSVVRNVNASGIVTVSSGPVLIGGGTSTGTASQPLQVTGGAYVSGNLGIGATGPGAKLEISATGDGTKLLKLNTERPWSFLQVGSGATTSLELNSEVSDKEFRITSQDRSSVLRVYTSNTDTNNQVYICPDGGNVAIGTNVLTGTASQPLQVTGGTYVSGNLGIGTTSPQYPLQVQGNARITGAIYDSTNSPGTSGQVLQSTVTGTQWATATAGGGGGSGKFDTSIDNVLYVQPTGTLDIVGVGTTTSQITTLPAGSNEYIIHSMHVTNVSNGDAEITAGFIINAKQVPADITVGGGPGIHTITVGSASSITVGMAVTGTGNSGETTGIGTTGGFQYNTYVTSVDSNILTLSKPLSGAVTGIAYFAPLSETVYRLPIPVGSAVELLKQPFVLNARDSIVLQSTGAGSGIGSTSTAAISQTSGSNFLTVTAGAAITNFIASGQLINGTGSNTGIQTGTYVGVGYTPGSLSVPMTKPATSTLSSQILSFTETVVPQDGALQATIVYQSTTDTAYLNGTGTATTTLTAYYGTGNLYPSTIQSIRVANISDIGDYPVWVGIGNSDTIFSWLAYNMVIPRYSNVELCEAPKRLGIGQSIFAYSDTPNVIEIQIAGKQKTS